MFLLFLSNALLTPSIGLIFWTTLLFCILWFLLGKFAWKPIVGALETREQKIADSLAQAEKAKEEMAALQESNEKLLQEAKEERAKLLKEAKEAKETIIAEAKDKAKAEASKIVADAQVEIANQKMAAISEVKNMIGSATVGLARQVLNRDLSNQQAQQDYIKEEVAKIKLN